MCRVTACSHERTLASPKAVEHWSLTTLREKLIKIGAKIVRHGRYVIFQMAEPSLATCSPTSRVASTGLDRKQRQHDERAAAHACRRRDSCV